jgi:hypothetical protein
MESLLMWLAAAGGALVVVAALVAWWEHVARAARPRALPEPATPQPVTVDVSLDALAEAPAGDAPHRRATLDGAMTRAAGEANPASAWVETRPMVGLGAARPTTEPH